MKNINLLVVEGNIQKENDNFRKYGIQTHAESLCGMLSSFLSSKIQFKKLLKFFSRLR